MVRKKRKWTLRSKLIPAIRKIWLYSPLRREALQKAKAEVGYKCQLCGDLYDKLQVDHIEPIVPVTGWTNWDDYVSRTFCDISNLQAICKTCHESKCMTEKFQRQGNKKKRAKKK